MRISTVYREPDKKIYHVGFTPALLVKTLKIQIAYRGPKASVLFRLAAIQLGKVYNWNTWL